jgi:hypothetical protein
MEVAVTEECHMIPYIIGARNYHGLTDFDNLRTDALTLAYLQLHAGSCMTAGVH